VPRRLGQHFLHNPSILDRIADAACPSPEPLVIEIGAGPGGLTRSLSTRAQRVVAIELDPVLAENLQIQFSNVEVLQADVLELDMSQWGPAVIAGNLPYYITSPIIEKVLNLGPLLKRAVFLVQKEVAQRLAAQPGSRDYGYLTVAIQFTCRVELLFTVKPAAFRPPPKVDSAVVRLTPHTTPPSLDRASFLDFVSLCFAHKRKTLRNNLAARYPAINVLPEARLRAEQLSLPELMSLFAACYGSR